MGISPTQLLIILLIVALIFGTKKLRNVGGDFGAAFKNFKKAMSDETTSSETGTVSKSPDNDIADKRTSGLTKFYD